MKILMLIVSLNFGLPALATPARVSPLAYRQCVAACQSFAEMRPSYPVAACRAECFQRYIRGQANAGSRPYSAKFSECETYEPNCDGDQRRENDDDDGDRDNDDRRGGSQL